MSDAREGSLNLNETVSRVTLVSLAAIPRLKYGTLAMIGLASHAEARQYSTNDGRIVLSIGCVTG
jgi:hypothetical protein